MNQLAINSSKDNLYSYISDSYFEIKISAFKIWNKA